MVVVLVRLVCDLGIEKWQEGDRSGGRNGEKHWMWKNKRTSLLRAVDSKGLFCEAS